MADAVAHLPARRMLSGFGRRVSRFWLSNESARGYALVLPTLLFMVVMLVAALATLVALSLWSEARPGAVVHYTLDNYRLLLTPDGEMYRVLLARSVWMSLLVTASVILFSYPIAYVLAFHIHNHKVMWLIIITIPFWINYLLRVFSWKLILGYNGVINSALLNLGLIEVPLENLLYNRTAVIITLTHAWAAFAILPIYVSLEKIDRSMLEAATDLGDGPLRRFLRITLPLSMPGVLGATLLLFIRNVGDYVTPALVGGMSGTMIGNLIVSLFTIMDNEPLAAAVSVVMMATITVLVCVFVALIGGRRRFTVGA